MKMLKDPTINFNLEPPTYAEITKIISKIKSSASPCPLSQVSVIAFKSTQYYDHILRKSFSQQGKQELFEKLGNLAYQCQLTKKGYLNEPECFCPITVQPVLSKIFTLVIQNRRYQFVEKNEYIKSNLRKDFWEKF